MAKDRLRDTILRGKRAAEWLENEEVAAAWEDTQADIFAMWGVSKSHERELREDLYRELHGLKAIRARLQRIVNEGKKAEAELKAQKDG